MPKNKKREERPKREISNASLFADDIVFSDTEKILFEEDLKKVDNDDTDLADTSPAKRYSILKKINEGGMKTIWEVNDHRTARKVAIALIQEDRIASKEDINTFLYEARLTANLQHPNIIPIYDIALDENGNPYFTMKTLKGSTLDEILSKARNKDSNIIEKFPYPRLLSIFLKVCNAIEYAHSKGVIHLDLKPSNIMIGDFGDVYVLDWGLSMLITHSTDQKNGTISWNSGDDIPLENDQTLSHYLKESSKNRKIIGGTPGYMAPEQTQGSSANISFQTDVYMLGAMLYEILTYQCPIVGDSIKETLQKTVRGDVVPPEKRAPERKIPSSLIAITTKAMAVDPADRYITVSALINDIHKFQDGFATSAESPTFLTHAILLVKRHKKAAGILSLSLLIIIAIAVQSFRSIKVSEQIALSALAKLQEKNEYIANTTKAAAPDYFHLMEREEQNFAFDAAEKALDTCLAFNPNLEEAWLQKAKILLCKQEFHQAWTILTGQHGHPVQKNTALIQLAEEYKNSNQFSENEVSKLITTFKNNNMETSLPRFFYHLNQSSFDPEPHFSALKNSIKQLNPKIKNLHFSWKHAGNKSWEINISGNQNLENITPLCGLKIRALYAADIGVPDLRLLTEEGIQELTLSNVQIHQLPNLSQFSKLQSLDISGTQIRNTSSIINYAHLQSLNISKIQQLSISPQLTWCNNLTLLTLSEKFKNDPTIRTLANRGTIIIHTD